MSSGLATKETLSQVPRGGWESLLHGDGPDTNFIFVQQYVIVVGLHFKLNTMYIMYMTI
jgi:hypothetical protein